MMGIRRDRREGEDVLVVSGEATITGAKELKKVLMEAITSGAVVHVVFENIAEIDVSVLQLLCAAHRTFAQQGRMLTVDCASSEPVLRLAKQAGFLRHIGCREFKTCLWAEPR